MTLSRPTGFPVGQGSGTGQTTLSVTPANVGDLIIISALVGVSTIGVASMASAGHIAGFQPAVQFPNATGNNRFEIWAGVATATGAATVTLTYTSAIGSTFTEIDGDSLHSSIGGGWAIVGAGGIYDSSSSTLNPLPTLTATNAGQAYWGISTPANNAAAGSTTGFTYTATLDSNFVCVALNAALSAGSQSPNAGQSPAGTATAVGAIFAGGLLSQPPLLTRQAVKRASIY